MTCTFIPLHPRFCMLLVLPHMCCSGRRPALCCLIEKGARGGTSVAVGPGLRLFCEVIFSPQLVAAGTPPCDLHDLSITRQLTGLCCHSANLQLDVIGGLT